MCMATCTGNSYFKHTQILKEVILKLIIEIPYPIVIISLVISLLGVSTFQLLLCCLTFSIIAVQLITCINLLLSVKGTYTKV